MPSSSHLVADGPVAGRVAVVTGASRGIGRAIALSLARAGCAVVIAAKSVTEKPNLPGTIYTVADEVRALGSRALPVQVDVRDDNAVEAMVANTLKAFGRLDFLICNSGALWWRDVEHTPMTKYDLVNGVNVRAVFSCVRAALPVMKNQGFGRIIVMSPPVDLSLLKGKVAYSISKFGMTMIAMGTARELTGTGVTINALWPATLIESFATKNFKMADRKQWRKADILADCVVSIVQESDTFSGLALIDEDYLASKGVKDLAMYRCVRDVEPRKVWPPVPDVGWEPVNVNDVPPGISARL